MGAEFVFDYFLPVLNLPILPDQPEELDYRPVAGRCATSPWPC